MHHVRDTIQVYDTCSGQLVLEHTMQVPEDGHYDLYMDQASLRWSNCGDQLLIVVHARERRPREAHELIWLLCFH